MRRWETLTALGAVVAASLGALPIPGRLAYTIVAFAAITIVGAARLRAALRARGASRHAGVDKAALARRIREERTRRSGR